MDEEKRGRGRPKIDTGFLDQYAPSRRQAMNAMYMHEGIHIITVAATENVSPLRGLVLST